MGFIYEAMSKKEEKIARDLREQEAMYKEI